MSQLAIRTERLARNFGGVRAVDDVSFEVPAGTIFGFLGPNGAGKTTTVRLLLGLLEPSAGKAEVLGFDTRTHSDEIRARSGALLEHAGLYERLSAEDNLLFYARLWRLPVPDRQPRIKDLLDPLGLWDRRKEKVSGWSRGMKQKLALARAMLHRPQMIFLDEPTAGLDPVASVAVREGLVSLAEREGVTVFLTTHNLPEAEKVCSQVGVIRQGKLVACGAPGELRAMGSSARLEVIGRGFTQALLEELRQRPEVSSVAQHDGRLVMDLRGQPETARLVTLMVTNGVEIEEVRKPKASLEESFLALMEESR